MPLNRRRTLVYIWALLAGAVLGEECPDDRERALHYESKLHTDLTCAYKAEYRPVMDHTTAIQVKVRLALKYINFDALEETLTVHSWVAIRWKDEFLVWTPSNYGDIKEIQIESHEIWTPRMALFNADASLYQTDSFYTTCLVTNEGIVTCVPHLAHTALCRTSLSRWPYDSQNCTLFFGNWMHTGEQVNFTFYQKQPVVLDDYHDGPGWKLQNVVPYRDPGKYKFDANSTYPMLRYTFVLKRESVGLAALVIAPTILIALLTLSSLLLELKDNVRLIMVCFSLFGHFIFLTEIGSNIPKFSSETPIILLFVRDSMILTTVAILETMLLMSLKKRRVPAPSWIVAATRLVTNGPGKYIVFTEFDPSDITDKETLTDDGPSLEEKSRINLEWMQFAGLLNSCLFIVTCLTYLVLIFAYIPYK